MLLLFPQALRALDQYHIIDRTHRKQYLYIKSIENLDQSQGSSTAVPSPLQAVVETDCYELVTHPLFQRLIEIKWHYLGRRGAWLDIVPNALLAILYTVLGVTFPDKVSEYYRPLVSKWWRVLLEMIVLSLLINEVRKEILELRSSKAQYTKWIEWRSREVKRDLEYCHPRCPQEKAFVERQVETAKKQRKTTYFQDVWNYLDWVAYSMMMAVFILHFATLADESDDDLNLFVIQFMSCTLIVMWIRMLKFARPFPAQGPFVVILDHIIVDTFRWSFIFLMIYIPYGAAFWMNFGGRTAKPVDGYKTLSELMFTMLRYPIVDSNDYETLLKDPHSTMPRLLGGTYLVIGALILMNMFIALMSHTFQRVYDNATATAAMQRARLIQGIEPHPLINPDVEYRKFINSQCCPEQRDYLVIVTEQEDQNRKQEEKISRLHSIINLRLGGKKFGKLDKSEFEIALEDIDSLKASIMKMNFSLKELSDRLEQVAESVHQDVGALGSSQAQIITQLKADQERDIRELRGDLNAKTESLKHFQAEKIDTLTALHAESVGELKVVHAIGQGELTLLHSQNTEDLKILQAEGVQEIKLQQALGFADLKLTQVQCSEELKPSPLQGNQEKNKRSTGQELKPYQLQMVEDLRLAKEQKFRDLKFSQEQDFNEMNLFQETTFENLKATNTQEFAQVYQSGHVRSSTKETGSRTEVEEERLPKEWINPPSDGNGLLQRVAAARDTQAKFIHTLKSSQAKKVSELRRLQASNLERFRQTQNENLIQIKQPEDLTSLGAKYEKLDKERERILSEERFIGGLAKVYAAPKGKLGGRAQRRDRKVSRAWNQKQLERRQTISNPDEEERSGSETLSAHSDGQKDRPAQAGHQGPVSGTERDTQESPNFARNGSIALEEVSTGSLSTSPETATDCENKNSKNNRLPMEKTVEDSSDLAAAKSRVDVSVDSLPQLESRPSDEGCKTELDPNHSSTHSDGPEGDDGDLLPSNSMGAQDVGENEIAKQENSCHLPPIAAAGDKGKEELTTPENGAKTAEQKDPPHANDRGVLPPIFSVKKRDTADKPGNEIENVRGIKLAKQSEGLILDNEKNTGSREHSGNEQSSIISTLPSLKSQPILRETELSSADCIEVKTGGKTGANLKMEAEKNEPGRDEVNGRRQSIRADQPDDKSNPNTSTDSLVFVNETNSSGTASSSDHHGEVSPQDLKSEDQEVEEFKPGTEGQEKRMSRKPKRRDSKGVPCGNHDAERGAKGTVRTDSDHIASLMKLYGGMKVDGKKKRQSKGKNLDKKPED